MELNVSATLEGSSGSPQLRLLITTVFCRHFTIVSHETVTVFHRQVAWPPWKSSKRPWTPWRRKPHRARARRPRRTPRCQRWWRSTRPGSGAIRFGFRNNDQIGLDETARVACVRFGIEKDPGAPFSSKTSLVNYFFSGLDKPKEKWTHRQRSFVIRCRSFERCSKVRAYFRSTTNM